MKPKKHLPTNRKSPLLRYGQVTAVLLVGCVALSSCGIFGGKQKIGYTPLPPLNIQPIQETYPEFQGGTFAYKPEPIEPLPEVPQPSPTEDFTPETVSPNAKVQVESPDLLLKTDPTREAAPTEPPVQPPAPTYRPIYAGSAQVYNSTEGGATTAPDEDAFYNSIMAEFEIQPGDSEKMIAFKQLKDSLDVALAASGYTPAQIRKFYILNYMQRGPVQTASAASPKGMGAQGPGKQAPVPPHGWVAQAPEKASARP